MDRRNFFLNSLFLTGLSPLFSSCSLFPSQGKLEKNIDPQLLISNCKSRGVNEIGMTEHFFDFNCEREQVEMICRGTDGSLFLVDDLGNYATIRIPIHAHSFMQHDLKKNLIWLIPNHAPKSLIFDLDSLKIVDEIEFPDAYFYGHGLILKDGTFLATMKRPYDFGKGFIIKFDPLTKKIEKKLEGGNIFYHDAIYSPKGDTVFASVRQNDIGHIHEISLSDLQVINDYSLNSRYDIRHLELLKNGNVFFSGACNPGLGYPFNIGTFGILAPKKKEFKISEISQEKSKDFEGEVINFMFNEEQTYAYTPSPEKGKIFVVNLNTMAIEEIIHAPIKAIAKIAGKYIGASSSQKFSKLFINKDIHDLRFNISTVTERKSAFTSHMANIKI